MRHFILMIALPVPHLAHVASDVTWSATSMAVAGVALLFLAVLIIEHTYVKHGRVGWRRARAPIAIVTSLALAAVVAPTPGIAQSTIGPMGLPDLVSDPSFIWVEQVRTHPVDGRILRTLAFDGILHNIGAGALDLAGNPQIEGGVKQRVFDGAEWQDVGEPPVKFETDDGHNHFHLMNAAAYTLWNEGQTEQVNIGDKVGFCLLDTMQIERGVDAAYLLNEIEYCNVDDPDATDLRMGISPGWVDIYEASITFQWVDTSNTLPGRYWVGSAVDPNDEIRESNEDNNGVVFSTNKYAVSGHNARVLPAQAPGEITLKSTTFGTVGRVAYVIVDPPEYGDLSVPTGVDVLSSTVEYTPEPGYQGTDSFSYYAHDTNTPFPFDPLVVVVDIEVATLAEAGTATSDTATPGATIAAPTDDVAAIRYDRVSIPMMIDNVDDEASLRWYGKDLPAGLTIDPISGQIDGELTMPGDTASTIIARVDGIDSQTTITWTVADAPQASLRAVNNFSTILGRRDIVIGAGTAETTYRAFGLPEGSILTEGQPSILGVPTEIGDFQVVVEELRDGQVVDSVNFTMSVRPAAKPAFVL